MPLNIPGILVPFQVLFQPRVVLPHVVVNDIRQLDFLALYKAGYRGAVFDKDNCLTIPHDDTLVPELRASWEECRQVFGRENVLIVSNSAGTQRDPGGIQAESVSYHLGVPVLRHASFKPSYSCIHGIRAYFSSLRAPIQDHQIFIVGDRIFTDVVLANRMATRQSRLSLGASQDNRIKEESLQLLDRPLSVFTSGVWKKESMLMRWGEKRLMETVKRWVDGRSNSNGPAVNYSQFVKASAS